VTFVAPRFTRGQVRRAGEILSGRLPAADAESSLLTQDVLSNWRASHAYPINTFQATLRDRLSRIDHSAVVAQRLKRAPSIIRKLQRFDQMQLDRMQDIGGLRAVVRTLQHVRALEGAYRASDWQHELVNSKDYVNAPKEDGYRGVHLIYRYKNDAAPEYDGLLLEIQIRSARQHSWATAVETASVFLGESLKSGEGDLAWRRFFALSGSAIAHLEGSNPVEEFSHLTREETIQAVVLSEYQLRVIDKLQGFAMAAIEIEKTLKKKEHPGVSYHLIILNFVQKTIEIKPYSPAGLEQASEDYAAAELRVVNGEPLEVVLVSAGSLRALHRAYPNYFLDTHEFIKELHTLRQLVKRRS
jgi:putative GTP pyrophosphokinase